MKFKVTIPLTALSDRLFGDGKKSTDIPSESTEEFKEANETLQEIKKSVELQENVGVKSWKDVI